MKKTIVAILGALFATSAFAQQYPDRPVKLVVPWAAGGDTDNIFRPFAPAFQKLLGQTVVIANVGGASGTKGAKEVKDSPPDGYTLYAVHDYIHSTYYTGVADVQYSDFEPICMISSTPSVLTASPKTPWKDWAGLMADAKARPGQITVGATLGSTSHFFPALIEQAANIKFKYVSYEGLAPRMNAILGGHVDLTDSNLTQKGKVEAGQLKFIAIATEKRSPEMPSVPTLKELGVNVVYDVNRGVMAPKGTPGPILARLESACAAAAKDPAFADSMKKQATDVRYMNRVTYAGWLKEADALNAKLAKDLGLAKK
jgi:tripartite-type tricarboxylate transporter receptor subunit TctC